MATESFEETGLPPALLQEEGRPMVPLTGRLLGRQIVQYAPGVVAPAVIALAFAVIFTRVFTSAEYGRFSLAQSVVTMITLLAGQWLLQGINRYLPGVPAGAATARLKRAILLGVLLVAAVMVAVAALGTAWAALLAPEWLHLVLASAALALATVVFSPLAIILQAEMRARRSSAYGLASSAARLSLALLFVFYVSHTPQSLLWAQAGAFVLVIPLLWRDAHFPPVRQMLQRSHESWLEVRRMAVYGFPVVGWVIAAMLLDTSDRWIIQFYRGSGEVGVYAANYSLVAGTVGLVATPMIIAVHPFLMRAWSTGQRAAAERWLGVIMQWYLVAGALLVGLVALYSSDIANLFLGPDFRVGHRIIPVVVAGIVAWQLGMYTHKPLEFMERTRLMFGLCAAATAVNAVLNLLLVPRFGYIAAAYTTLFSFIFYVGVTTWAGRRLLRWRLPWKGLAGSFAVSAVGFIVAALLRGVVQSTLGYVAGLLASGVVALATSGGVLYWQFGPLLRQLRRSPG